MRLHTQQERRRQLERQVGEILRTGWVTEETFSERAGLCWVGDSGGLPALQQHARATALPCPALPGTLVALHLLNGLIARPVTLPPPHATSLPGPLPQWPTMRHWARWRRRAATGATEC